MKSSVSSKGQVTIPKAIRDRLGIRAGTVLEFAEKNGELIVARKVARQDPVSAVYGILKLGRSTDEIMTDLRGGESEP